MTVSSSQGRVAEWHDRRITTPQNADKALADKNQHWIGDLQTTDAEKFNAIFEDDVKNFNEKQTRPSRKMGMESTNPERQKTYYDGVVDGTFCYGTGKMKETPIQECVLQIGNKNDNGVTDESFGIEHWQMLKKTGHEDEASEYALSHLNNSLNKERTKRIIHRTVERIAKMCPDNLVVIRADWHEDEPCGTGHCHMGFVLKATGYKNGMESRVASVKALEQMGFKKTKESEYGITQLHERFKEIIEEEMVADALDYGYEPIQRKPDSGEHRQHSDVDVFRKMSAEREALNETARKLERHKTVLQAEKQVFITERKSWRKTANTEHDRIISEGKKAVEKMMKDAEQDYESIKANVKRDAKSEAEEMLREASESAQGILDTAEEQAQQILATAQAQVKSIEERENAVSKREDTVKSREDRQTRREVFLDAQISELKPVSVAKGLLSMIAEKDQNMERSAQCRAISSYIDRYQTKLDMMYKQRQERIKLNRQQSMQSGVDTQYTGGSSDFSMGE